MDMDNLSCLLYGPGKLSYEQRPIPNIEDPYDVLIEISFVGVCGSDVHFWKHGGVTRKVSEDNPLVMGHEASGIVHSIGSLVTSLRPGDRVAIEPGFACRRCKICKSGRYNLCQEMKFAADPPYNHGTLTRFFRIPEDFAYKIADCLSLEEAVLVEPLSVAVPGVRLSEVMAGRSVLVLGSGTIGLLSAAVAKAFGASAIYIADISSQKRDFAKKHLGCATFSPDLNSSPAPNSARFVKEAQRDCGVDVVLECTGVETSAQTGLYALKAGGVFVQIGLGKAYQSIPLGMMCEKEITIKTAFRYGPGDYETALELLAAGIVHVKPLISSVVSFESASEAWEKTAKGEGIKNLIQVKPVE